MRSGPERGAALGVLRTAEMEEAARRMDADVAWLGHGPDDPVHDFGFSKNGDDTLRRWGEERIVERLVRAYRQYRPDIVIPTFLDVPGQHGHHRAMTRAAEKAFVMAADPAAFPEHGKLGLRPWQVCKFYLPAWSGAGYAYDDEVPPPPATLSVQVSGGDEVTGLAYRQLGEWSRAAHASQGMGIWRDDPVDPWSLHLKLRAAAHLSQSATSGIISRKPCRSCRRPHPARSSRREVAGSAGPYRCSDSGISRQARGSSRHSVGRHP